MKIERLFYGSWYANCYLAVAEDEQGKLHAAVIDPAYPADKIKALADSLGATVDLIIMTHGHFDHIYELDKLASLTDAQICIHKDDAEMLSDGNKNAYSFFFGGDFTTRGADRLLSDGDEIKLGNEILRVISTPGHSKGSICLMNDEFMITGDTIFEAGYGRYDLHGGDGRTLLKTLRSFTNYDGRLTIYPGHGDSATLSQALRNINIFMYK